MRFFGKPWSAPATDGVTFEPAPVGEPCAYWDCREPIGPDDQGVFLPWANPEPEQRDVVLHRACLLAEILGPDQPSASPSRLDWSSMFTTEDVARVCHEAIRTMQFIAGDPAPSPTWDEAPESQRTSTLNTVEAACAGATPEQLHEAWCSERTALGWVYGEAKDPEARTHPCMVPYSDPPAEQQQKDALFHAIVNTLLKS